METILCSNVTHIQDGTVCETFKTNDNGLMCAWERKSLMKKWFYEARQLTITRLAFSLCHQQAQLFPYRNNAHHQQGRCCSPSPPTNRCTSTYADPACPLCKEEPQTLEHWLQRSPNLDVLRQHTFGSPSPPLGVLTTDPEEVLALARATF